MRVVGVIALFACHVEAVKLTTSNGALQGALEMVNNMLHEAEKNKFETEQACTIALTEFRAVSDTERQVLTDLIGPEKTPGSGALVGGTGKYQTFKSCGIVTAELTAPGHCNGRWGDLLMEFDVCFTAQGEQAGKEIEARNRINLLKWNSNPGHTCAGGSLSTDDVSICATNDRIDAKTTQLGVVAKECKKTSEIMEIAINIYSGKAMGSSFIQLAQEENIRADAKAFLESHSETERHSELLNLLHDFKAQMMRDCHQDLSEFRSDINALNKHLTSQQNSVASEEAAERTAARRKNEAQNCMNTKEKDMNDTVDKAKTAYDAFTTICGCKAGSTCAAATECVASSTGAWFGNMDWACTVKGGETRVGASCQSTLMWKDANCNTQIDDLTTFIQQSKAAAAVLQDTINAGSFIQLDSIQNGFIQVDAEQNTQAVDFSSIVTILQAAIENETKKATTDSNTVNQFAEQCAAALPELEIDTTISTTDCAPCLIKSSGAECTTPDDDDALTCLACSQECTCFNVAVQAAQYQALVNANQDGVDQHKRQLQAAHSNLEAKTNQRQKEAALFASKTATFVQTSSGLVGSFGALHPTGMCTTDCSGHADEATCYSNQVCTTPTSSGFSEVLGAINDLKSAANAAQIAAADAEATAVGTWDGGAGSIGSLLYLQRLVSSNCPAEDANSYECQRQLMQTELNANSEALSTSREMRFTECTSTNSVLSKIQAAIEKKRQECEIGVTKDLAEELHSMQEALQILTAASSKITGNTR